MVTGRRVFVRVINRPLEHGTVDDATASPVAASDGGYSVSTLEAVEIPLGTLLKLGSLRPNDSVKLVSESPMRELLE